MARKKILYFFSFNSPYAALSDLRIDQMVDKVDARLEPIPLVPPPLDPPSGLAAQLQQSKMEYMAEDCVRWAKRLCIPWSPPAAGPVDTRDAVAGYYYARERGKERDYRNAVFRSRWCEGKDIGDRTVLAACASDCRLSANDFLQALRTRHYHSQVDDAIGRALENSVFGVPTFVVDGERYWGNDRLEFLLEAVERDD